MKKMGQKLQTLHCDKCKDWLRLEFKNYNETVDGIHIIVPDMPILVCHNCNEEYQPDWTRAFTQWIIEESKKRHTKLFKGERKKETSKVRYDLCKNVNFKYDASDCKFIPGLQSGFAKDGFFTPVFFDRRVLHKYLSFDEYRVDIAGNTYGTIFHNEN
jgi:YgiT-type zinc finger domain-containing protein